MKLLGKPVAQLIENQDILPISGQKHCHLAIVLVGQNPQSAIYVREKVKAGRKLGLKISVYKFLNDTDLVKIQETIRYLNEDDDIAGIILQLPLPNDLKSETDQLISLIYQSKDVDSLTEENRQFAKKIKSLNNQKFSDKFSLLKKLYQLKKILIPPTAAAVMEILSYYKIELNEIVLIGRGLLVGSPVAKLLDQMAIPYQVIHSQTNEAEKKQLLKEASVIISGTSSALPIFSNKDIDKEAVIIDCAHDFDHNNSKDLKTQRVTPLIGGVGPVTVACLLRNVVLAKKWQE